jgi:hypothetical protein
MKKIYLFASLFLLANFFLKAQTTKETAHVEQVWLGYFNQTRFSEKWGMWADGHLRSKEDFVSDFSLAMARLGLTYYLADKTKLTVGYAYIHFFPSDNHPGTYQPENRLWQQLQWHTQYKKIRTMQWLRLEERYRRKIKLSGEELAAGYNFNFRLRYNLLAQFPLSKKGLAPKTFAFVANDEIHVNFGKEITYNYFDQNRFFVGFSYLVNAHDNLQFGYMNVFQQLAAGNKFRSVNTLRVFYFHNIDLRRKEKE